MAVTAQINERASLSGQLGKRKRLDGETRGLTGLIKGEDGTTFIPSVDEDGILSWTNDGGRENPEPVNIKGAKGDPGPEGPMGPRGEKGDKGDTGPAGPQGEKGADGTGVTILGAYDSEEALNAAHPTGSAGDAYLINEYLYVWSASESIWKNVGQIQGPEGPRGEKGETGAIGPQGPQGEKGATGDTGPEGPQGEKGADGYTPKKGTDYWTEADIAEIKAYVDEAILGGAW